MIDLRLVDSLEDELSLLLALNREDKISTEQLARLDLLLELRGREIDEQVASCWATDKIDKYAA